MTFLAKVLWDAMISALRKIEGCGELPGATSAVMEPCLDNRREGFSDLFATHPSVESRVQALVRYAGGHYEGPLALPMQPTDIPDPEKDNTSPGDGGQLPSPLPPGSGPWGGAGERQGAPEGPWGRPAGNQLVPPIRSPDSSRGNISSGTSDRKRH